MKLKFTFVFILFAVLMVSLIIINHSQQLRQASFNLAYFAGKPVLERVFALIDGDRYEALTQSLDEQDPFYIEMQEVFREVKRDSQCLYLYTLTVFDDGTHRFILDAEEPGSEYFSYLGEVEDVSVYESAYWLTLETKEPQFSHLENIAEWGLILSAYKPIFNSSGEMIGVIGVDFDSEDIYYTIMSSLWMQIALVVIFIIVGLVIYFFFLKDLSRKNETLNRLNRTKTVFLQDMSHEIRTPLNVISYGTDYIRHLFDTGDSSGEGRKILDTMQNEALRLGRMVDGMVELATMDGKAANREKTDFAAMLKRCAESMQMEAEQKNNKLHIDIQPGLPFVYAEAEQLQRVPVNLLSNAICFTEGGEITLKATVVDDYITVKITDTGTGISPDFLSRVFGRGVSGRGGEGFGLSICKTIVEAHGGAIEIENEPGGGTSVTFTVPAYGGQSEVAAHE